jgi:hypothetical protein
MKGGRWLTGFVVLLAGAAQANDKLSMQVSPVVAFAPATLRVQTTIEPDAHNRTIVVIAESPEFFRSSEIQLDGASAPKTSIIQIRSLPTGEYSVRGILRGPGGDEIATVERKVNIVESGAVLR